MASADLVERVRAVAARVAAGYGLEIFDVQFRRESGGMVLRVQIDRPGPAGRAEESVSIEDCAHVSRDMSAILDVDDAVPTSYTLEVSSPGLDRPLRGPEDYRRFTGRRAKLVLREAVDGQTFLRGRLDGLEEEAGPGTGVAAGAVVVMEAEGGRRHRVPVGAIARANLEVEF
jgi:ribosome maturation factor RimP